MVLRLGGQPNTIFHGLCPTYLESQEPQRSCCDFRYLPVSSKVYARVVMNMYTHKGF